MAKAIATCTCAFCGKQFEKIAYKRNRADAESWKDWVEKNCDQCPDCYRAAEAEKASTAAQADGLPQLTGSPKQIAWAEQIRQKFWNDYLKDEHRAEEWAAENGQIQAFESAKAAGRSIFQSVNSAKEYIDSRNFSTADFIKNHAK